MKRIVCFYFIAVFLLSTASLGLAESTDSVFQKGEQFFSQGNYSKAIEYYEKAIELDPNNAEAFNKLGLAYKETHMDLAEVAWYFKAAMDIDPKNTEAYVNLARAYYGLGRFDEAIDVCQKALTVNPQDGSAQLSLAWTYLLGKQEPQKAIYYFNKILDRLKIPYAYFGLGLAYFMDDQRPMVLEIITKLRGMDQDKLATQLEDIVRSSYYASSTSGPLVNAKPDIERQEGVIVPFASLEPKPEDKKEDALDVSPIAGTTRIRLRGTLMNVDEQETDQDAAANKPKAGEVRVEQHPALISPSQAHIQRLRDLKQ
ncbi:MAG: tetratricopeptide repeat protein [Candidatus Omnitrophota bacterium]